MKNIVIAIYFGSMLLMVAIIGGLMQKNSDLSLQNESLIEQVSDYQELVDAMENNRSK